MPGMSEAGNLPDSEEIADQLARRDRLRQAKFLALTPAQRLEEMGRLQERANVLLRSNPAAYQHFWARNYKARATDYKPPDESEHAT